MGIRFRCHHCEHELNLKDFQAGRRARCPACSGRFRVPTTSRDFSTPLEDDEQELAPTPLRADQPGAGRSDASPSFELKQPTGDLERFKRSPPESKRAETPALTEGPANPVVAKPTAARSTSSKTAGKRVAPTNKSEAETIPGGTPGRAAAAEKPASEKTATGRPAAQRATAAPEDAVRPNATQAGPAVGAVNASAGEATAAGQPAPAARAPGIPRAIAEAPQAVWYVRPPSGGQFGPADSATFYQWMAENRVARESLVWRDGWPQWMIAAEAFEEYYGSRWLVPETTTPSGEQSPPPVGAGGSVLPAIAKLGSSPLTQPASDLAPSSIAPAGPLSGAAAEPVDAGVTSGVAPVRPLGRRKRRKPNYALGITVLAIVAVVLVAVLIAVLMRQ